MMDITLHGIRYIYTDKEEDDTCLLHNGKMNGKKAWLGTNCTVDFFPSRHKVICLECMKEFKEKSDKEQKALISMWKIKENR